MVLATLGSIEPIAALLRRAHLAGRVRVDAVTSDLGCVVVMLCHVGDLGGTANPDLWRRYLPTLLSALRPASCPGRRSADLHRQNSVPSRVMPRSSS